MESDESLPRLLSARYRLEATLGHGGMGIVYRATDLTMKRPVAVKLIRAADGVALDEEVAGRFLREAKNTARIHHENIIEVYDLARSETNDLYMVMELLEGESLSVRLRRETRLSPKVTVHIARQICAALDVAHAAGIIHRDLKPANVMLIERAGDDAYVKVLDFGVAKSYSPDQQTQLTHTGMLVGTVEYMAPEQIMGKAVDGRTDIYSLGIVLYRMLAGRAPFRDGGVPAMIHAHLNVMPQPIQEQVPEIPGELDRVVLRCLAKRPEQRYDSMAELARALKAAIEPEDLGLVNLDYEANSDADPYDADEKTEIGRSSVPAIPDAFDDATLRIDRPVRAGSDAGPPPAVPRSFDETAVMAGDTTAKRSLPEEVTRVDRKEPKTCAMCQTLNAPHVRACVACGISLAADDQDAVRARVTAPRTAHMLAPQMPPPASGAFPSSPSPGAGAHHAHHAPHAPMPMAMHGGSVPPWGHGNPHAAMHGNAGAMHAPRPPSIWERFLAWTGLRGR